jgi:ribosomal protein S18 acetylase RimI-like enzyme
VPGLSIRRYEPADEPRVKSLHEDALRAVGSYTEGVAEPDLDAIRETYIESDGEFLVGHLDGTIVAMGGFKSLHRLSATNGSEERKHTVDLKQGVKGERSERERPWFKPLGGFLADAVEPRRPPTAMLKRMRVDPEYHRQGYGRKLYRELERRMRECGYGEVVLDTDSERAKRFYEAMGFSNDGTECLQVAGEQYEFAVYRKLLETDGAQGGSDAR